MFLQPFLCQGKLLEAPELIPFRLTRDIVAGMGIGGLSGERSSASFLYHGCISSTIASGEFQATSESVLDVIRRHQSSLLSVLEIILHDPLYRWVLTPAQTQRLQSAAEGQEEAAPPLPAGSHDLPPPLPRSLSANHAGSVVSPDISTDALRTLLKCKAKMKVRGTQTMPTCAYIASLQLVREWKTRINRYPSRRR